MTDTKNVPAFALRDPGDYLSASTVRHMDVMTASETDIAKRAYEKYEIRGRLDGFHMDDWLAASRELAHETFGHLSCPSLSPTQFPVETS
jgi:hypothetical protein